MTVRGLRKDAERNREKLIAAGRQLLAERGEQTSLNEVASVAGVGVGTAYRRFPDKHALFDAIFDQQIDELEQMLQSALRHPDAWQGLVEYLEGSLDLQAQDIGLAQILSGHSVRPDQYEVQRDRLAPLVEKLVLAAKLQGTLREDVTGADLVFLQMALVSIAAAARGDTRRAVREDVRNLHRRYLWLILDGLRRHPHPGSHLPIAALTTDQTHRLLSQLPLPAHHSGIIEHS